MAETQTPVEIEKLTIQEVSLVDHPAHLEEGWAIVKSRDGQGDGIPVMTLVEELEKAIDANDADKPIQKDSAQIQALLTEALGSYLSSAPNNVQSWAASLVEYLKANPSEGDPEDKNNGGAGPDAADGDDLTASATKKSVLTVLKDFFTGVSKDREDRMEKALEENWEQFQTDLAKALTEGTKPDRREAALVVVSKLRQKVETAAA